MLSNTDFFLVALFIIAFIIYEMVLRGVLTIEILRGVFSGNVITYIIIVGVFLFLRIFSTSASAESQKITKLEKTILALNNDIQKIKGEAEWDRVSQGKEFTC